MLDGLRYDLTRAVVIEPIHHYAVKTCQAAYLSGHLSIHRRQRGLTFYPQCHRPQNCERRGRFVARWLELENDFAARLMDGYIESRSTRSKPLTIEAFDDSHASCNLQASANLVEERRRQTGLRGLADGLCVSYANELSDVL
jgi:hypothetical protein